MKGGVTKKEGGRGKGGKQWGNQTKAKGGSEKRLIPMEG